MPVEPPIEVPASLAEAFAILAGSTADTPITPIAGGTDLMVRITGEITNRSKQTWTNLKAYLFAFIDDYSRALPGYRWGHAEDTVRLEAALRHGLGARGVPRSVYVDNGSAFVAAPRR